MVKQKAERIPRHVNLSNELVRAAHGLTLTEKRLLMLAISKLDSKAKPVPENLVSRITVLELISEYGLDSKSAYKQAYDATEHLMSRYIRLFHEGVESRMQWVGQADYKEAEGLINIHFWHNLAPMLFELKNRFTSYQLNRAGVLRSVYSWRLFELLMQFKGTGVLNISIDDFNHALETPDSLRANFANLRGRVIEPAIKEIANKDGLKVAYEPIKAGRKVKALKFTFKSEKPEAQPKPSTYRPIPPDTELETIDKPMTKVEAQQLEASVMATVHPMLKPVAKITKEQAEQEFSALRKLASDIGSTVEKLSSVQQKEAFKEYGFLK